MIKLSQKHKNDISIKLKMLWKNPEYRQKMIDSAKNRPTVSEETRKKIGNSHRGLIYKPDSQRNDRMKPAYREWSMSVKKRDGWKCKINNRECLGRIEAHHILNWVDYPELRYDINNGISLCHSHHPRGRLKEQQLSPYFKELIHT